MKIFNKNMLFYRGPPTFAIAETFYHFKTSKHIYFILLGVLFSITSYGQLTQQHWLVGGNGSFYDYNENYTALPSINWNSKYTNIQLSTSIGYFFIDKFAGEIRSSFSSEKGHATSNGTSGSTNSYRLAAGPFARYYFLNLEKQFNILADVSYQIGINKFMGSPNVKGKNNTFSLMAGSEVFFNSSAGLEILLGYSNKIISIDNSQHQSQSNKKGFQVSIGFQLHLIKD